MKSSGIYYQNGTYLVSVRPGADWHDLREFVMPHDPQVQALYQQIGPSAWAVVDWVCRNVPYALDDGELWRFPAETLARGDAGGDCDDSAILACSILRNFTDAYVVLGAYRGLGHAWCQANGQILETTFARSRPVPDPWNYQPYALFNDQVVIELWPGALDQLFTLARAECKKLSLLAEALGA